MSLPRISSCLAKSRVFIHGTRRNVSNAVNLDKSDVPLARKRVILSGIQPTGTPHLGNYLGALSNWVQLQRCSSPNDTLLYTIVGWHALTLPQDPKKLLQSRREMLATLLAIGLDPKRSIIFHQDHNPHHTELAWILSCLTPFGKLKRMTTWKSRLADSRNANSESEVNESLLNAGLFTYPVLQAADILVYRATHVPVGEDQTQHLELSRDIAQIFNQTYKRLFTLPEQLSTPSKRILSLKNPAAKMSKSAPDVQSRILLTDSHTQIKAKIRSAVTDSVPGITYDPETRPGTSNLLTILGACTNREGSDVAADYLNKGHGELKADVAEAIEGLLRGPRNEFERLREERGYLDDVAKDGAERARALSEVTILEVRRRIGLS
ncbi:Tryptophan--tRNA ligase, mitochondrial [Pleurotus pulmonarius]|nr:Tryptophan--tRNA ligase, mitochondrial [Pleurotus pulmonarius]KAF4609167.1 Tryptophan--tRNA ligase, mitochondrial [Pleurotus pulmonarius]